MLALNNISPVTTEARDSTPTNEVPRYYDVLITQQNSCCSNSPPGPADPSSPEDGPSVLCVLEHRHLVTDCLCKVMEVMTNSIIQILLYLFQTNCSLSNVSFPTLLLPTPCGFEGKQREDLDYIINERCSSNYIVLDYLCPFPY